MKTLKFDHTNPKHWNNLARRFRKLAEMRRQGSYTYAGRIGCAGICHAISELRDKDWSVYEATSPINKLIVTQKPSMHLTAFYWPFDSDGMMSRSKACDRIATIVKNQKIEQ
jgi:hypothetical protein